MAKEEPTELNTYHFLHTVVNRFRSDPRAQELGQAFLGLMLESLHSSLDDWEEEEKAVIMRFLDDLTLGAIDFNSEIWEEIK